MTSSTQRYNNGTSSTKKYRYDAKGRIESIADENTIYSYEYHPDGTIKRFFEDNQSGQPNFHTFEEMYGEDGRVLWNEDQLGFMSTVKKTRNEFQYDDDGVVVKMVGTSSSGSGVNVIFEAGK